MHSGKKMNAHNSAKMEAHSAPKMEAKSWRSNMFFANFVKSSMNLDPHENKIELEHKIWKALNWHKSFRDPNPPLNQIRPL